MYKKCYQGKKLDWNLYEMHLWESDDKHQIIQYENVAFYQRVLRIFSSVLLIRFVVSYKNPTSVFTLI